VATPSFPVSPTPAVWGWPGLKWDVKKSPEFKTAIHPTVSGRRETRLALWALPRWHFNLEWEFLRDQRAKVMYDGSGSRLPPSPYDELRRILGFFLARRGAFEPFFFTDPTDFGVIDQTLTASSDGGRNLQALRSLGGQFVEPVGGVVAVTGVKINGVAQSAGYVAGIQLNKLLDASSALLDQDGWLVLPNAPSVGSVLAATFTYAFKVRFKQDLSEFENLWDDLWRLQHLELYSVPE